MIFDFDGTLYDSEDEVWRTISHQKRFVPELAVIKTRQDLRGIYKGNFYEEICRWNRMPKRGASALAKRMHKSFVRDYDARLFRGMRPALRSLAKDDALAVVSSNYAAPMRRLLRRDGVLPFFKVVSGADGGKSKTVRVKALLRRQAIAPKHAVYVTDTVGDVKEARKDGLRVVGVGWGFHSAAMLKKAGVRAIVRTPAGLVKSIKDRKA